MVNREPIKRDAHQAENDENNTPQEADMVGAPKGNGPDIIQFSPNDRKNREPSSANEAFTDHIGEEDDLLEGAIEELRRVVPRLEHSAKEREEALRAYLARAYKLSMAGLSDPSRHEALLLRTKIRKRCDTPHHKQTLRAIQTALKSTYVKGNEHEWSLVLAGMEEAKVPATEDAVIRFLTEPANVDGKMVCGFDRPKEILRSSNVLKARKEDRIKQKRVERQDAVTAQVRKLREEPLGSIEPTEDRSVSDTIWISINEGDKVLLDLRLTDSEVQNLIFKHKNNTAKSDSALQ